MKKLLALLLFCVSTLRAQVPVALSPTPRMQFFSEQTPSLPLAGGKVCTFNAGTTTPAATYADIGGVFQNSNPIVLDGSGFATIYLANQEYKFIVYDSTGNTACPNTGVQQWAQDNVSAFQAVVGTQTIIFAGVTSDPVGQAGMVDYRTDLGRLRFFNSAWDSIPGLATIDTLTNKTLTAPTITNPTITATVNTAGHYLRNNGTSYIDGTIQPQDLTTTFVNDAVTGTSTNFLAQLLAVPVPDTVAKPNAGITQGVIGICVSGCGTTGSAQIQTSGLVSCSFDGATGVGDYVGISATGAGQCHDASTTGVPANGKQTLGRVLSTNAGTGVYQMLLFGPEISLPLPPTTIAAPVNTTGLSSNTSFAIYASIGANGFYRMSCYVVLTQAATTSSTLPQCNVIYTDADSSVAETIQLTSTDTTNTLGAVGRATTSVAGFYVKALSSIQYSTSGYASVGATPMQYAVHVRLEGPF